MSDTLDHQAPAKAETKGGVVAYLNVEGALRAAEFYVKAFGAEIASQMPPDDQGRTMHVHLYVNGSSVMLSDFYPEHGHAFEKPQAFSLTLIVDDIDAWHRRAVAAGATTTTEPQKMFWGDYYGEVVDPFGVRWAMNQAGD
ncbi:VOC family protein [Phenylobacterium sp. J426]|uniref:VOC family protein n=1 Tax=Phenylobacterium sp. J426 TaxID=2898439 RepID=UPI0021518DCE|nr:VOC family protein [Phenylobacterium sp. J426]MCR5874317.1 VOC family protein [Phenylobacterium sp. J426]